MEGSKKIRICEFENEEEDEAEGIWFFSVSDVPLSSFQISYSLF